MLVTSRSFAEYAAFFGLDPEHLPGRVLDCCAGTSGFVAGAVARGVNAIAADPIYAAAEDVLATATRGGADGGAALIADNADRFTYAWYGTPQRRAQLRSEAAAAFQRDRRRQPHRYVAAALPALPFRAGAFDLALCSHLLFTWADRFGADWHRAALTELCRVADEVRVFPIVRAGDGADVAFLPALCDRLATEHGIVSEIEPVSYEFQVGARHLLRLRHDSARTR